MNSLTNFDIMDYKEKLELAKDWYNNQSTTKKEKVLLEKLFPELKESEDERIRRNFKSYLQEEIEAYTYDCRDEEDRQKLKMFKYILAWFEKHCQTFTKKDVDDERIRKGLLKIFIEAQPTNNWGGLSTKDIIAWLEKQGEQKPTDKIEPKFKVGDWILRDNPCQIESIDNNGNYIVRYCDAEETHLLSRNFCDSHFHLWTIQDAKDGDVLVCESGERTLECLFIFKLIADREVHEYCSYRTIDKHFSLKDSFLGYVDNVYHVATKEQRDILFSKMKEAGYEWDFDKKELRKIDDYCKENCKGFQETGKCYADGKCKAKREVEQKPADETPYSETLDKAIDLYCHTYGNGKDGFESVADAARKVTIVGNIHDNPELIKEK